MTAAIIFDNVTKKFTLHRERGRSFQEVALNLFRRRRPPLQEEEFWALRNVSFTVEHGETVGLIGPNGAGKSTALKLITRIIQPTAGRITINGRVGALLELGAGFHPDLTGRENIYLNGSILGLSREEIRRKLDVIVSFSELERFIDVPVKHYSSGMYVRLGFSIAVHTDPEILLVDEVLSVGDQNFQHKCLERIREMQQEGVTIFFVSHGLDQVRRLCSRAIWLNEGTVQAEGRVDDTISAYLRHAAEEEESRLQLVAEEETAEEPEEPEEDTEEEEPEPEELHRWGTQEIEIVAVSFLDDAGQERNVFRVGEPWTVRLRYRAVQPIERPVFGLAVHRDDGVHVCGPNTQFGNLVIPAVEGEGEVLYRVPHLPLMEGTYHVSVSSHNWADTVMYDYHDRLYTFRVRQVGTGERYGLVSLGGTWEWHPPGD
ncbi:MAG TPA: ABC transporter ATP-binding protein [Anaerolineae bacterium]|nr:ABC transporter ATP-binding protein [Anaerolineae bacterium]